MPTLSPAPPAIVRNRAPSPRLIAFGAMLAGCLARGVRPGKASGDPWSYEKFAAAVDSSRLGNDTVSPRSVSNWCKGERLPVAIEPILDALFGATPGVERTNLQTAYRTAHAEKAKHTETAFKRAKLNQAGAVWVLQGNRFVRERKRAASDAQAAKNAMQQRLQSEICTMASELAEATRRPNPSNSTLLGNLSATASMFGLLLKCEPAALPAKLPTAYRLSLQLGAFLDTDDRVKVDLTDAPFDADVRGQLSVLVRLAAPWLRGFPSVAAWDEKAAKALFQGDLVKPALRLIQSAAEREIIVADEGADLVGWLNAVPAGPQVGSRSAAQKLGGIGLADTTNLLHAAGRRLSAAAAGAMTVSDGDAMLAARLAGWFTSERKSVTYFAASLPPDLRQAYEALTEGGLLRESEQGRPVAVVGAADATVPSDVEKQAVRLILAGQEPPSPWRPFISTLHFPAKSQPDLRLLRALAALKTLDLSGTLVSDVSPLAGLTAIQHLYVDRTRVGDVSALAKLRALRVLYLGGTAVNDVSGLAGLMALEYLDLVGTSVSDVSSLSGLTALKFLDLSGTPVRDVSALAGLRLTILGFDVRLKPTVLEPRQAES